MKIIDNINSLLGGNLRSSLKHNARLKIAASSFSIYAYEALRKQLEKIASLEFIFTTPSFVVFEIQLRNKLTQRAIAHECAKWVKSKVTFKSNKSNAMMQQFICVENPNSSVVYTPLNVFTAVDLGYQSGNAVSNFINCFDETTFTNKYSDLLNKAIASMIDFKEEKDIDSLFSGGKTTALLSTISGLDDFELIAFLVIQESQQ